MMRYGQMIKTLSAVDMANMQRLTALLNEYVRQMTARMNEPVGALTLRCEACFLSKTFVRTRTHLSKATGSPVD